MLGYVEFPPIQREPYRLTLGPYGYLWFELHAPAAPLRDLDGEPGEPVLAVGSLREGPGRASARGLRAAARSLLMRQRWFGRKSRVIDSVSVSDFANLPDLAAALLLLDVALTPRATRESYFVSFAARAHRSHAGDARQTPRCPACHLPGRPGRVLRRPQWMTVFANGCSA